jgi:cholesterol transport system auxiliary component
MKRHRLGWLALTAWLAGCTAPQPLPDFRYYALPAPTPVAPMARPKFDVPVVVDYLRAEGVRGERPILYTSAADRIKLLQYHYQLWSEPPTTLVQQFLIQKLESSRLSPLVTDQLSLRLRAVRLTGDLLRFERTRYGESWSAAVTVRLRALHGLGEMPLLDRAYSAEVPAADGNLESSVAAFQQALDRIGDDLLKDLQKIELPQPAPAAKAG